MSDNFHPNRSPYSNQSPDSAPPAQQSSDWMWRPGSFSGNVPRANYQPQHQHQPQQLPPQPYTYGQYPDPNTQHNVPHNASQQVSFRQPQAHEQAQDRGNKVAIPRATAVKASAERRRSARACESCRQRKVKCDGARPICRKCREHGLECSYIDIKRIRDQKQLGSLSSKVDRYERLMRQMENDVDPMTARRIRKALAASEQAQSDGDGEDDDATSDADSTTTHGSLEDIDLVKEDLNRNQKTVATGYFGKNSEIAWLQKLEDVSEQRHPDGVHGERNDSRIPIQEMSYHLDDLDIPLPDGIETYGIPPKPLADLFVQGYMESVHPSFAVVRRHMFLWQYEELYRNEKIYNTPRKWLAVLNMIFALGCRYCRLTRKIGVGEPDTDDTLYLNRARKLCLGENALFDHDDLQQIQVNLLVAFYLVALGQINRASKFSSMALRAAISLGINLRFKDDKTPYSSKEARIRLWWSIFMLEHLLTSITGRISGCGEELSAALLPMPFEEECTGRNPGLSEIFRDENLQSTRLQLSLCQTEDEASSAAAWLAKCSPSSTLVFHCIVDLLIIAQTVINSVYSIQGLREHSMKLESRLHGHSRNMDTWLCKVPFPYRFTISPKDDSFYIPPDAEFLRERITLATYYYSARITLCRPCLSHTPASLQKARDPTSRASFRSLMTLACLRASCSLLSILPDQPDTVWLTSVTPWWAILHFIMQATTALLIGLSISPASASEINTDKDDQLPSLNRDTMIKEAKKAVRWLHHLAFTSTAARRAFALCERVLSRMGGQLGFERSELPTSDSLPKIKEGINLNVNMSMPMGMGMSGMGSMNPNPNLGMGTVNPNMGFDMDMNTMSMGMNAESDLNMGSGMGAGMAQGQGQGPGVNGFGSGMGGADEDPSMMELLGMGQGYGYGFGFGYGVGGYADGLVMVDDGPGPPGQGGGQPQGQGADLDWVNGGMNIMGGSGGI